MSDADTTKSPISYLLCSIFLSLAQQFLISMFAATVGIEDGTLDYDNTELVVSKDGIFIGLTTTSHLKIAVQL